MNDKKDLNNGINSEYSYWKNQSNRDTEDEGYHMNEETGEYRYSKKIDSDYYAGEDNKANSNQYSSSNPNSSSNNYTSYEYGDNGRYSNNNYSNFNQYNNEQKASGDGYKEPGKGKKFFGFIFKAIAFGLIVATTFIGVNEIAYKVNPELKTNNSLLDNNENETKFTIEQTKVIEDNIVDTDVTQVVTNTMPSIVTITGTFTETYDFFGQQIDDEKQGGGSGIIIDKNDTELLIATNNHVVEGAMPIMVTFIDGETAEAIIKGTDSRADLAVIAVDLSELSQSTKDAIEIADVLADDNIRVGEKVVAIGNALGIGQSVTVGYVSAVDRDVDVGNNIMTLLQTDAAINPGNSGGALLNMDGEVIGINTIKFAANAVEGMGYAIPITRAMPILNELKSREIIPDSEQGYLGVYIRDVTEDIANMFNWPVGVYVSETTQEGPAFNAGILKGDIIIGLNDIEVTSTTQLIEKVTSYRAGIEVTVRLMRNQNGSYEEIEVQVTLEPRPSR